VLAATPPAVVFGGAALGAAGEAAAPLHALSPVTRSAAPSTADAGDHDVRPMNIDHSTGRWRAGGHPRRFDPSELLGTPGMCA
jgi:hypothetical protein